MAKTKISRSGLETIIKDLSILEEEKKMWMTLGFYVSTPSPSSSSSSSAYMYIYDSSGGRCQLTDTVANNLRKVSIEWWEAGAIGPRPSPREASQTTEPLDELEARRG